MRPLLALCALLIFTACTPLVKNTSQAMNDANQEAIVLKHRLKDYFRLKPYVEPKPTPIPSSYCYNSYQDIVCFKDPQEGAEFRLVGYQEPPLNASEQAARAQANQVYAVDAVPVQMVEQTELPRVNVPPQPQPAANVLRAPNTTAQYEGGDPYAPKPLMPKR